MLITCCAKYVIKVILACLLFIGTYTVYAAEMHSGTVFEAEQNRRPVREGDRTGKELIPEGETLHLDQVLEIGLKKNPARAAALNSVQVSQSRVGQARAGYYPQISLFSNYYRINPPIQQTGVFLGGQQSINAYSAGVSLSQNIFDFFRTSASVDIARFDLNAVRADLDTTTDQIALNIKQAYYGVLQAKWNRRVAEEVVRQMELHLEQVQAFYQVGIRAKIDLTKAQLDLSNARLSMIRADNNLKIARINLNNAMGVPDAEEFSIEDNLAFRKYIVDPQKAIDEALKNRPELQSVIAQEKAAESLIAYAKRDYGPVVTGSLLYQYSGVEFPLDHGWMAGVSVSLPVFSGFLTTYQVREARYTLYLLKSNEEAIRQQILLDFRQAFLNLGQSEESILTSQLAVTQAAENLDLARNRYKTGVGSSVEVSDAFAAFANAHTSYITSLYGYKIAQALIEKAIGRR